MFSEFHLQYKYALDMTALSMLDNYINVYYTWDAQRCENVSGYYDRHYYKYLRSSNAYHCVAGT
jgi:hypothetical protein